MIKHIVFWNLADKAEGLTKHENAALIKAGLERLVGIVDGLVSMHVGVGFGEGWDLCLVSDFTDKKALKEYDTHPEHLKVRELVKKVRTDRVSCDYEY
mgnify:CR=1 FL=1